MAFNKTLASRVRDLLSIHRKVEEKKMMGGLTFMVNAKMCVGILDDELMVRIAPEEYENALQQPGCREMDFTGRPMKGFVFVSLEATRGNQLRQWISLALQFNKISKSSKKKKTKPE